jgi:structural maintenance of chromosome 1
MNVSNTSEKSGKKSSSNNKENTPLKHDKSKHKSKNSQNDEKIDSTLLNFYLKKVVVQNFKSFEGKREIGDFLNFSAVIGPNGSGKSNILDAICFGLGMKPNSLRSNNLKELIYKNENESEKKGKKELKPCFVQLHFEKFNKKDNKREETIFKRTIVSKGASEFIYNSSKVSQEEYLEKLEKLNFPSLARYYILLQGSIDSLLSKKNTLTQTFEHLSGSIRFKEQYDTLKSEVIFT